MAKLEENIKQHRKLFDTAEPEAGHTERFAEKLKGNNAKVNEAWWSRYGFELRIAAGILIFLSVAVLYYTHSFDFVKNMVSNQLAAAELPAEVREVLQYYNVVVENKVDELDDLPVSDSEAQRIRELAEEELAALEEQSKELKKEYALNSNDERVKAALIMNEQKKAEILDKIINKVKNDTY